MKVLFKIHCIKTMILYKNIITTFLIIYICLMETRCKNMR